MAFGDEAVAKVRTKETGRAGDEYAHCCSPLMFVRDRGPNVAHHFTPAWEYGRIDWRDIIPVHE
jgi:hypothetical protein